MKLNIKTKILLNGILSVVISIILVTVIVFFLLWKQGEKRASQQIHHAIKVIDLQIQEMEADLETIAAKIGNQQDYASKANFIQENKNNKILTEMLAGEKKELAVMLYEVVLTGSIPSLTLYDAQGDWMCAIVLSKTQACLDVNISSDADKKEILYAVVSPGKPVQSDHWRTGTSEYSIFRSQSGEKPAQNKNSDTAPHVYKEAYGKRLCITAVSPLNVRMLNPKTLKEELVQNGMVKVSRYLDNSFIHTVSSLTDTQINLFVGSRLSAGNLIAYKKLNIPFDPKLRLEIKKSLEKSTYYTELHMGREIFFEGQVPIFESDRRIGTFSVLLSQEETRKAQWQMLGSLSLVALICIIIIMPLTYFLAIKEIIARERMEKELARYREHLEELVQERTIKLAAANAELDQKNIRLNQTLKDVEDAHREIMENLHYAKTIQRSLLPAPETVKKFLPDSFFIWMPKDIVGGDIFHADIFEDGLLVAVIDCTGHGVPGAFMTMIAASGLRRITRSEKCHNPAEILKRLNYIVKTTLQQDTENVLSDDGMDAAICFIEKKENGSCMLTFAGAKLPLIYVYNDDVNIIKGDRESLGYKNSDLNFNFTNHTISVKHNMSFYITSDGFTDQLGGEKGLRFGSSRLKKLLQKNTSQPFENQEDILIQAFNAYKGENEAQDDVTVAGFGFRDCQY